MNNKKAILQPEGIYHVYQHANGFENLFKEEENYRYFLQQWSKYISPIADTYAYCLMPNHIHFLIRIKEEGDIILYILKVLLHLEGFKNRIKDETIDTRQLEGFKNPIEDEIIDTRHLEGFKNPIEEEVIDTRHLEGFKNPIEEEVIIDTRHLEGFKNPIEEEVIDTRHLEGFKNPIEEEVIDTRHLEGFKNPIEEEVIDTRHLEGFKNPIEEEIIDTRHLEGFKNLQDVEIISKFISKKFSNLFNSYSKAFNKRYNRRGSLFIPNFKRKQITTEDYLKTLVCYIHRNPIHHGFCDKLDEWKHSSYHAYISDQTSIISRSYILEQFEDKKNFMITHLQHIEQLDQDYFMD
jgi:REP element-mobilizing transposase RayT